MNEFALIFVGMLIGVTFSWLPALQAYLALRRMNKEIEALLKEMEEELNQQEVLDNMHTIVKKRFEEKK